MSAQPAGSRAPRRAAGQPGTSGDESQYVALDRRRALKAFDWGALATIAAALLYGVLWGAVQLQWGLIAIAILLGWLIGAAIRHAAWRGLAHHPTRRLQLMAAIFGLVAWFGGAFVAYLASRAVLPASDLSIAQRLADVPFDVYMTQQYEAGGITHAIGLAALVIMGWRTAR